MGLGNLLRGSAVLVAKAAEPVPHTSFFTMKKEMSLCYGLGLDLVHQDFHFQSIREKRFKKESRGWQTLDSVGPVGLGNL